LSAVDEEIRKLRAQLPPIDYSVLDEDPYGTYDDDGHQIQCSCVFQEVTVMVDPLTGKEIDESEEKIQVNIIKSEDEMDHDESSENHVMDDSDQDDEDFCIVEKLERPETPKKPLEKPRVKSIFDDDYDDDNDPIYSFLDSKKAPSEEKETKKQIKMEPVKQEFQVSFSRIFF
jgi:hypothetical protein